jgi:hypothetical protein
MGATKKCENVWLVGGFYSCACHKGTRLPNEEDKNRHISFLSASFYLASAVHISDFGSALYDKTRIHRSNNILYGGFRSIFSRARWSYCYNGEMLFWW